MSGAMYFSAADVDLPIAEISNRDERIPLLIMSPGISATVTSSCRVSTEVSELNLGSSHSLPERYCRLQNSRAHALEVLPRPLQRHYPGIEAGELLFDGSYDPLLLWSGAKGTRRSPEILLS